MKRARSVGEEDSDDEQRLLSLAASLDVDGNGKSQKAGKGKRRGKEAQPVASASAPKERQLDAENLTRCLQDIVAADDTITVCSGGFARELPLPCLVVEGVLVALPLRPDGPSADLVR
jgi:hypothetical protein